MTREVLTRALEAHLHHEGRRRGRRLTRAEFAREVGFVSGGQDLSDFTGGRMSPEGPRELLAHKLLEPAVEAGAEELAQEIEAAITAAGGRIARRLARITARHLYGLDGGER